MGARRPRVARHVAAGAIVTGYLLAAVMVIVVHSVASLPSWLALHLLVLGAATNAVFVWSRHFAQALLHARHGSERPAWLRLGALNAGVVAVLVGVSAGVSGLAVAGAVVVVGAVIAHGASVLAMIRSATSRSAPLNVVAWYYVAAAAALAVGAALGGMLAAGTAGSPGLESALVVAHAQLNLLGWLGLAIIGTQFILWPMVLRTRMTQGAPRTARRVLVLTAAGLAVTAAALLASPWLAAARWLAAAGIAAYLAGAAASLVPAVREIRARPPRTAPPWAFLAGSVWLLAALAADMVALAGGPASATGLLGRLLVPVLGAGVVAQVLIGALTFLLPVTAGGGPVGNRRLAAILECGWRSRAVIGNAGVLVLAAGPADGGWRLAAWAAVLAGFGTYPVLVVSALAVALGAARRNGRRPPGR